MPSFGNIILADGQSPPVNHTFKPVIVDKNDVANYNDNLSGIPLGYPRLSISLKVPKQPLAPGINARTSVYRAKIKVDVPVLEVTAPATGSGIQPAPTVAYANVGIVEFVIPARGSLQDRKDILAYLRNALAHASVVSVIQDLESIY